MTPAAYSANLPGGILLVDPVDPTFGPGLGQLLATLAKVGIEQFIVPKEIVEEVASLLADKAELGLTLSADAMTGQTVVAGLPTALLLPKDAQIAAFTVAKLREFSGNWPNVPMIVVGKPERLLDKRRLDQTISSSAPILEDGLRPLN